MSAIDAALNQIDEVAADGDLTPARHAGEHLELETPAKPILLPDGKRSTRRCYTASRSTGSPARCWTCTTPPSRGSCG